MRAFPLVVRYSCLELKSLIYLELEPRIFCDGWGNECVVLGDFI